MKMPTDPQEVKNMMGPFKATNEADKKKFLKEEPEIYSIDPGDHYSLKQRIDLFQGNLETMLDVIEAKLQRVTLLSSITNQLNTNSEFYNNETNRMKKSIKKKSDTEDINKRLVEFYDKDYNIKSSVKKYFKYIYYLLIIVLLFIVIYKKLHKNKKILAFLAFLIIFPLFILTKIFDKIMSNVGHFKLDVLYLFIIVVITILSYGGFLVVKKLVETLSKPNSIKNPMEIMKGKESVTGSIKSKIPSVDTIKSKIPSVDTIKSKIPSVDTIKSKIPLVNKK